MKNGIIFGCSLYREESSDGKQSAVKWTCPHIHDLTNILYKIKVDEIMENSFDKRLSNIADLTVVQLREECAMLNLKKTGNKVRFPFHQTQLCFSKGGRKK